MKVRRLLQIDEENINEIIKKLSEVKMGLVIHKVLSNLNIINENTTREDVKSITHKVLYFYNRNIQYSKEIEEIAEKIYKASNILYWKFINKGKIIREYSEKEIIVVKDNILSIKRPDKILEYEDKVILIDFKLHKQEEKYIEQIKEYKDLLSKIFRKNVECYIFYISNFELVEMKW
ncbi:MAG: hypothetical protein ACPL0D_01085 [Thermosulfidibacteraceae bacterium]